MEGCAQILQSLGYHELLEFVIILSSIEKNIDQLNGKSLWCLHCIMETQLQVQSDASGGLGFGICYQREWHMQRWPEEWTTQGITFLEFFPVLVVLSIWGEQLRNKKIQFWCNCQPVIHIVNQQSAKSARLMRLVNSFEC